MIRKRLRENILVSDIDTLLPLVEPGSRVLDLGCGRGELLSRLVAERNVRGMGVEIDPEAVIDCIHKGLSVFHGDIDAGLADYSDASYDVVILNQTLQVIHRPDFVIQEMLRVGRRAIVSFPNFGHWRVRLSFLLRGRMPRTPKLPFEWYNTPNIHLLTIRDFKSYCRERGVRILRQIYFSRAVRRPRLSHIRFWPNGLADEGIFVISRERGR